MDNPNEEKPDESIKESMDSLDIKINEFGEIRKNLNIEKINEFLNQTVDDKKLKDHQEEE